MINTKLIFERFLQKQRFKIVEKPYLVGEILDFGGNEGELAELVNGNYTLVNYDHAPMEGKTFDNIIALAVIEHIHKVDVYSLFSKFRNQISINGHIVVTTPTPRSKFVLELLANIHILEKENILEHKHYWKEDELYDLARQTKFEIVQYRKFQLGYNQICIFKPI